MKKAIVNIIILGTLFLFLIQHPAYLSFQGYVIRVIQFLLLIYIVLIFFSDFTKYVLKKTESKFSAFSLIARRKYRKLKKSHKK